MSRIGNKHIKIPAGTNVSVNGNEITVSGKLGTLVRTIDSSIKVEVSDATVILSRVNNSSPVKAKHGLYRSLLNNMVQGVSEGFKKSLTINGVGYKVVKQGNKIVMSIGYSHPVEFQEIEGIKFELPTATEIVVCGIDKELVGQVAANIKLTKPVEPYHHYGIKYTGEYVRKKEGKTGGKK